MKATSRFPMLIVAIGLGCGSSAFAQSGETAVPDDPSRPSVDVAIALDTSSSMEGLITTTRLKLWEIVNDLALAQPAPRLRVALLSYGNSGYDAKEGYVRIETPLTTDLDLVSRRLFELTAEGGNEYVARVLRNAIERLDWSTAEGAFRFVFIAGNETANLDTQLDLGAVADEAKRRGILVSAVFCGSGDHPDAEGWKALARRAEGRFATIDQGAGGAAKRTPFDEELAKLGSAFNETLVPLGGQGSERMDNVSRQDKNAAGASLSVAAARATTKASPLYVTGWDLVDAVDAGTADVYTIDEAQLPEKLRTMSPSERETYVQEMRTRREDLRRRISELTEKRSQFMVEQGKAKQDDGAPSFDKVVRQALRETLQDKGVRPEGP